ncbi:hypothetical protein AB1207_21750 [Kineococcus endophyticus]|uniref:Acetyltransferase (GNAT) family protein n=1 Tax=Kineococcus endophyticus TaxID=1181883 RepID=A0ABV3PCL9_9ACTN
MRALDLLRLSTTSSTQRARPAGAPGGSLVRRARGALTTAATTVRTDVPRRLDERTTEAALAGFLTDYVSDREEKAADGSGHALRFAARNPLSTAAAVVAVLRLPTLPARLGTGPAADVLRRTLLTRHLGGLPVASTGVAVLDVPADPAEYVVGANRQTLRRKVRAAQKKGVGWRVVDDPAERRLLVERANAAEQVHADTQYRNAAPDNADLLEHDLWLVATDAEGEPIMLSVTPVDGEWGLLRYFRTLGASPAHSDARYLLMPALVDALAARGVRYLTDSTPPPQLSNGLRHFQRMVGYRYARVKVTDRA